MKKYVDRSKSIKRSKEKLISDRNRIGELILQGYSHQEVADMLTQETGVSIARRTVTADVAVIRKDWLESRRDNYDALINQELDRIDSTEKELWKAWRASSSGTERKVVEEIARQLSDEDSSEEEFELVVSKVTTVLDTKHGVGDVRFFDKIISIQKERRRLLGLYAPARLGIDLRQKTELVIKGYAMADASPDVWPSLEDGVDHIIEGDYESRD
jgi:hypothetical protein